LSSINTINPRKMKLGRSILNFAYLGIASLLCLSCQTNRDEVFAVGKKLIVPTQTGKDITLYYTDSTTIKIKLDSPYMLMYDKDVNEPFTLMPKGLHLYFYDDEGKQTTTLRANYGIKYDKSKRTEVKYDVEIINLKGEKLNTEHLIWDEANHKIFTNTFVKISTGNEIIMGNGIDANEDFTRYEIKEVTGRISIENADK
jgi:LPS export ABC transporter protein LptC